MSNTTTSGHQLDSYRYVVALVVLILFLGTGFLTGLYPVGATSGSIDSGAGNPSHPEISDQSSPQAEVNDSDNNTTASISSKFPPSNGTAITVSEATLPEGGFISVYEYNQSTESYQPIGVSEYLDPGSYENVTIELFEAPFTQFDRSSIDPPTTLSVRLHKDTNSNERFDFFMTATADDYYYSAQPVGSTAPVASSATTEISDSDDKLDEDTDSGGTESTASDDSGSEEDQNEEDKGEKGSDDSSQGDDSSSDEEDQSDADTGGSSNSGDDGKDEAGDDGGGSEDQDDTTDSDGEEDATDDSGGAPTADSDDSEDGSDEQPSTETDDEIGWDTGESDSTNSDPVSDSEAEDNDTPTTDQDDDSGSTQGGSEEDSSETSSTEEEPSTEQESDEAADSGDDGGDGSDDGGDSGASDEVADSSSSDGGGSESDGDSDGDSEGSSSTATENGSTAVDQESNDTLSANRSSNGSAAAINFSTQKVNSTNGPSVVIDSVVLPEGGFVVVSAGSGSENLTRPVGVTEYLGPGRYENVTVRLMPGAGEDGQSSYSLSSTQVLVASAVQDANENQQYDPSNGDRLYLNTSLMQVYDTAIIEPSESPIVATSTPETSSNSSQRSATETTPASGGTVVIDERQVATPTPVPESAQESSGGGLVGWFLNGLALIGIIIVVMGVAIGVVVRRRA